MLTNNHLQQMTERTVPSCISLLQALGEGVKDGLVFVDAIDAGGVHLSIPVNAVPPDGRLYAGKLV